MSWIAFLPLLFVASLVVVLWPVIEKNGNQPLPAGLEDDPRTVLEDRRLALLAQLKEMEQETARDPGLAAGRERLEAELAELFAQLDRMKATSATAHPRPAPETWRVSGVDKGFAGAVFLFMATCSAFLYLLMGTTETIVTPERSALESSDQIDRMLDQAARRLAQTPENLEGWMRLARSYVVMQRPREAMAAYSLILRHHPEAKEARDALAGLKVQHGDSEKEIEEGAAMLRSILAEDPDHREALWFLGGLAFRAGAVDEASGHWKRLLELLPPDDPNREMVRQSLENIKTP
ncbi:MAG: hypothetical protein HQL76_08560 [Magnetococcales bacterium]|nr:hypothetical protein [Magnetococcales bacterium]